MYLQSRGLTHHDIKPANLLKESDEKWVLADYGHSCALGALLPCEGTHHYASPQTLKGDSPTLKDAVWEIATTALEILGADYLLGKLVKRKLKGKLEQRSIDEFYARQERAIFRSNAYGLENFLKHLLLFKLFLSCIRVNPAERLDLKTLYSAFEGILAKNDDEAFEEAFSLNKSELQKAKELKLRYGVLNVYKDFLEAKRLSEKRLNPFEILGSYHTKRAVWRSGILCCGQDRLDFEAFKKLYIQPCPLPIPLEYPFLMTALTTWKYIQSPDCPFYIKKKAGNSIQSYSVVIQPKNGTKQVWFCVQLIYKRKGEKSVYKALNLSTFEWMAVTKISGERAEFERSFPNSVKTGDCPDLVPDFVFSFDVNKFNGSTKKAMGLGELYTGTLGIARLPLSSHLKAMLTLLRGEKYLIDRGWTQGDLKPTNIFIRQDGRYLLGDFGLARRLGEPRRSGTNKFAGPEVFQNAPATEADSSWQAGATGLSLLGLNLNAQNFVKEKINKGLTTYFMSGYFEILMNDLVGIYLKGDHEKVLELFNLYKSCHDLNPSKRPKLSDMIERLSLMEQKLK
ncbi:MAG: hypothetical protein KDK62_07430 [Chlamydiia bacterium]|nr:hypothetical protein [Chlamydiia bacterium]